ncbi:dimethylamine monooxygenase subunit DmmA family protein [Rossellomorea aquimaris]|uniref:dimethylamine monooxygenase subunit DmmA family protein n=1 Tax=Rossellomorea aquimaris TaxID=189382 RepID=UPI0007D04F35|nr:dimethylamine monooxygenase subunit DmmA family protein [Rossellomorea aquimaris]
MIGRSKPMFIEGKNKYLFYADKRGLEILAPIMYEVRKKTIPLEVVLEPEDASPWLRNQKMGSYLYICTAWEKLERLKSVAEEIGYSEEEAQYIGYGVKTIQIFCCRCHGLTEVIDQTKMAKCDHCQLKLSVSDHYSSLRQAYLGYIATIK